MHLASSGLVAHSKHPMAHTPPAAGESRLQTSEFPIDPTGRQWHTPVHDASVHYQGCKPPAWASSRRLVSPAPAATLDPSSGCVAGTRGLLNPPIVALRRVACSYLVASAWLHVFEESSPHSATAPRIVHSRKPVFGPPLPSLLARSSRNPSSSESFICLANTTQQWSRRRPLVRIVPKLRRLACAGVLLLLLRRIDNGNRRRCLPHHSRSCPNLHLLSPMEQVEGFYCSLRWTDDQLSVRPLRKAQLAIPAPPRS